MNLSTPQEIWGRVTQGENIHAFSNSTPKGVVRVQVILVEANINIIKNMYKL